MCASMAMLVQYQEYIVLYNSISEVEKTKTKLILW